MGAHTVDPILGSCHLDTLRTRKSYKWRTYPGDVLPSFVAEMDFDLAEPIKEAVHATMAASDCGYPHVGELGAAFAEFAAARLGWSPDPGLVYAIPDVMTGIVEIIQQMTPPGSGVVLNPPVYPPFLYRLAQIDRIVVEAPLRRADDGSYDLDMDAIERALDDERVSAYLLCSPHNPVGRVWSASQLTAVADACQQRGTVLVVDEIHGPLVLPGARFVPFLSLDHPLAERTIALSSASKAWNIPGLKCGLAVAGGTEGAAVLTERWEGLLASHVGVQGTVAAFRHGLPWLDALLGQLDQNRQQLTKLLAEQLPAVGYRPPEGSFLAWLDCRELGLGRDPAATFLAAGRVALSPGADFGVQGNGFARLNIGTSPELVTEAVRRMAASVPGQDAAQR
jgi:cysteine-S-conjugate beta-lyase